MKIKLKKAIASIALAGTLIATGITPAQAGTLACTAKIKGVLFHVSGALFADFDGIGVANLCSLNGNTTGAGVGTISAETCKAWASMFITAKSTQQNVTFVIDFGAAAAPACTALGWSYTAPAVSPYFISLAN